MAENKNENNISIYRGIKYDPKNPKKNGIIFQNNGYKKPPLPIEPDPLDNKYKDWTGVPEENPMYLSDLEQYKKDKEIYDDFILNEEKYKKLGSIYESDRIVGTTKADELRLTKAITVAGFKEQFGAGGYENGSTIPIGTSISEILQKILCKELWPAGLKTLSTAGLSANINAPKPSLTATTKTTDDSYNLVEIDDIIKVDDLTANVATPGGITSTIGGTMTYGYSTQDNNIKESTDDTISVSRTTPIHNISTPDTVKINIYNKEFQKIEPEQYSILNNKITFEERIYYREETEITHDKQIYYAFKCTEIGENIIDAIYVLKTDIINYADKYNLTVTYTTGDTPKTTTPNIDSKEVIIKKFDFKAISGTNTVTTTETGIGFTSYVPAISTIYACSNLGNTHSNEQSAITYQVNKNYLFAHATLNSKSVSLTGVYPIWTNGTYHKKSHGKEALPANDYKDIFEAFGFYNDDPSSKAQLGLINYNAPYTYLYIYFGAQGTGAINPWKIYLPNGVNIEEAKAYNSGNNTWSQDAKFEKAATTTTITSSVSTVTVYEWTCKNGTLGQNICYIKIKK